jgi:hypothetical protein
MSALLADPAVQDRVREDPALREMWSDPAVRHYVTSMPVMMTGMEKLMELVRLLLEDPAVRTRIQADPTLREMWAEAGVRQHIQRGTHH